MYSEVFLYFLRLGLLGFGGPLAIIGSIQLELVERRRWISSSDFNASYSLIKAMPGPVAFMTAVFMGRHRAGFWGGLLAGFGIVFPAFCLMIFFSLFFSSIADLSFTKAFMQGMQIAALGVILGSLKGLIKSHAKEFLFWALVAISGIINYFRPSLEPLIILQFGVIIALYRSGISAKCLISFFPVFFFSEELAHLALVCFKAGSLVFGTGLAIVPMLEQDVVNHYHWLTHSEFLNALAFGQITPGPVVITATYIGHKVAGIPGAIVGTIAIFSAALFHMSTWFPYVVTKLKGKLWIDGFVFGALAAVVGPIIVTVYKLGASLSLSGAYLFLAFGSFIATLSGKIPPWVIIPIGGVLVFIFNQLI